MSPGMATGSTGGTAGLRDIRRFERWFAATILGLMVLTIAAIGWRFSIRSAGLDLAINTLAAVAAAGAGGLAWFRYREIGERPAIFESSAFLVVFANRALLAGIAVLGAGGTLGLSLDSAQQWPIYAWTFARSLTAVLLILAAVQTLRPRRASAVPVPVLLLLPTAALLLCMAILPGLEDRLPVLLTHERLDSLDDPTAVPGMSGPGLIVQGLIASLFLLGAALHRDIYRSGHSQYSGYLTVALVVAAFSQLHWAVIPGIYTPTVTADEFLNAAFSIILLLGIEARSRTDARDLRRANARLEELRAVEVERAALMTRAQLAREVHDGLAQELWFAKLKSARLVGLAEASDETRELAHEVGAAVDRALGDARAALTAIRAGLDGEPAMAGAIEDSVADFARRTGLRSEFTADGELPALSSRTAAELLRILFEAMTNIQKHADATLIRVTASAASGGLEVSIADDGRGFDPAAGNGMTYGIRGMRERAELIGATLDIVSAPSEGTAVTVRLPIERA